jgi:hypothetical protein
MEKIIPTQNQLNEMYSFIRLKMDFYRWYEVKSTEAMAVIEQLFTEGIINDCELSENFSHFRKVHLNFDKPELIKAGKLHWFNKLHG